MVARKKKEEIIDSESLVELEMQNIVTKKPKKVKSTSEEPKVSKETRGWMERLTADFGMVAADMPDIKESIIPTASASLNWSLGGGYIEGKAYIFAGAESSGKSLLSQLALADIQRKYPDGLVIIFDAEYAFNPSWAKKLGLDLNRTIVRKSNDPVKIFDYMWTEMLELIQDGAPIKAIMLDSIRAIAYPKDIKDVSTKMVQGGSGANYLPSALKRVLPVIREHNITFFGIQQVSENMDMFTKARNPYIIPDGRALKHFADCLMLVEKLDTKADGILSNAKDMLGNDLQTGHKVRIKNKKNRLGAPARVAEFSLDYTRGIVNKNEEIFKLGDSLGVFTKVNAQTWKFKEYDQVRGKDNFIAWIKENPFVIDEILKACLEVEDTTALEDHSDDYDMKTDITQAPSESINLEDL